MFPGQASKGVLDAITLARRLGGDDLLRLATLGAVEPGDFESGRAAHLVDRTEVLQPLLVAIALTIVAALEARGTRPALVLGHSLGELSAWAAIGGLSPQAAVELARVRGEAMATVARARPGGMVAIATSDPSAIADALAAGRPHGDLDVAAYNAFDETVLTGDLAAIRAAERVAPRAQRLRVAGAWHAPRMSSAADTFPAALARTAHETSLRARLVTNGDGSIALAAEIPSRLAAQLTQPVAWTRCLTQAVHEGCTELVAIAPSATLRALIIKHLDHLPERPAIRVRTCDEVLS